MCDFNDMERVNLAKLVKSLRICGDWKQEVRLAGSERCEGCKYRIDGDCKSFKGDKELLLNEAADAIEQLTADVRPVVRGHKVTLNRPIAGYWASGKLDGGWDGMEGRVWVEPVMDNPVDYCSECGKRLDDTFQNFCPNCGAKMDGEA